MIKTILWDIDGTLLDFLAAEKAAIKKLFIDFGFGECSDEMIGRYSAINKKYWESLERGEISKPEVLVCRFKEFFTNEGLDPSRAEDFNSVYQVALGDTIVFCDDSKSIISELKGRVKQYAVSNGTIIAQNKKLKNSGLGELFDGVFLSEELGVEKPNKEFFDKVFEEIGPLNKDEVLIVGDSLTSDIKGGMNAGIKICWYNPEGKKSDSSLNIHWTIRDLHEILDIATKD